MAENRRRIPVPRDAVWRVLCDGPTYSRWVVGTSEIRGVDDNWPQLGAQLHYRVGRGPFRHDGHTEVLSVEEGRCLELEAHAWPLGTVRIELTLVDAAGCCLVTMVEHPARGVVGLLHNRVGDALLKLRNVEALRRLDTMAREIHGSAQRLDSAQR
jgi:uncharacterized protein YndB with AHSA1/START domain